MDVTFDTDLPAFADVALPWLAREPILHNVAVVALRRRCEDPSAVEPDALWMRVLDGGRLAGVALHTPPHPLLLPALPPAAAEALADAVADIRPGLVGVIGPEASAEPFTARWIRATGARAAVGRDSLIYRLDAVRSPAGVPGTARPATGADTELLTHWFGGFRADVGNTAHASDDDRRALTARRIADGHLHVWECSGAPVAMAMRTPAANGVVRVQAVYTPPEHRRHGYAAALVAAVCDAALAEPGVSACTLYTDAANPTSNGVYRRIGFEPLGTSVEHGYAYV